MDDRPLNACRSKYGNTGAYKCKSPEPLDKFKQYFNGKFKLFPAALVILLRILFLILSCIIIGSNLIVFIQLNGRQVVQKGIQQIKGPAKNGVIYHASIGFYCYGHGLKFYILEIES